MPNTQQYLSAGKAKQHRNVNYVDAKGQTQIAEVVGGSGATLTLRLAHGPLNGRSRTASVPLRTALTDTGVFYY